MLTIWHKGHKSEHSHVMHVDSSSNSIRMKRHIDYRIYNQYDMRVIEEALELGEMP